MRRASSARRSIDRLRWLRLASRKKTLTPSIKASAPDQWRSQAPLSGSILITSAPRSASICTAEGPCRKWVKLRTLMFLNMRFDSRANDSGEQPPRDDHALDLGGALHDLEHLGVAEGAGHRVLAHDAVAAMDLDRLVRRLHGPLGGEQLGHRRLLVERPALVLQLRRVVEHQARG